VLQSGSLLAFLWWTGYTIVGVWAQKYVPGIDFFASGIVLSLQEQSGHRTLWLACLWILLLEGMGNLPFGYGVAWYGLLFVFYILGRWLFERRSILFMCLLGLGLGCLHIILSYSLTRLANMAVPMHSVMIEGALQVLIFPVIWLLADWLYPKRLRQDVKPL